MGKAYEELNVKPGDKVKCVSWLGTYFVSGDTYVVNNAGEILSPRLGGYTKPYAGSWELVKTLDWDKPLVNGFGETVRRVTTINNSKPVLVVAETAEGKEYTYTCKEDGSSNGDYSSCYDITNKLDPGFVYLNIYKDGHAVPHKTLADADFNAVEGRIARIKVNWEEGQYDN